MRALGPGAGAPGKSGWSVNSIGPSPLERLLDLLGRPSPAHLEVLAGPALDHAMAEARQRMGDDPAAWAWGRLHRAHFEHPLATTPERAALLNLPDVPRGGDGTTVNNTGMELRQAHGASFREVIDLADWDRSLTINVPGQSGQPGSRHYGDLLPLWAAGQYHPLVFSRAAVERAAAERLWLPPKGVARPAPAPDAGSAAPPELPTFVGSLVNFDRRDGRVAACALEPGGGEVVIGARKVPRTFVWVIEPDRARQLGSTPGSWDPTPCVGAKVLLTETKPNGSKTTASATTGTGGLAVLKFRINKQDPVGTYALQVDATDANGIVGKAALNLRVE